MGKIYATLFLLFVLNDLFSQNYRGTWNGAGYYAPGQVMTTIMQKVAGQKLIYLDINSSNLISGSLVVIYDKSKATIASDGGDQVFTITGKLDTDRQLMLLVLTHVKLGENQVAFKKPDSVYYSVALLAGDKKPGMTGVAGKANNKNVSSEWIGSSRGQGLGMNIAENIGMHMLPLTIKLENTYLLPPAINGDFDGPLPGIAVNTTTRKIEIQRTIILDTSFITIDLYDNGEIDGDIATIILDGKTILDKQSLGTRAASLSLNLSKDLSEHVLQLFANNMGSIPPNTALLVLTCNRKRYEINLSSNGTVNGSVKLVFR